MPEPQMQKLGRLAMRAEGDWWKAYYALPDTMEGALLLGQVQMAFTSTPERRQAFMGLMRDAISDIIQDATGNRPSFPDGPEPAPEHERAGTG